jgi:putative AdoMet-dependent methyltransferase
MRIMGREFLHVFKEWADSYDDTVSGRDPEYEEVFANYEQILDEVASRAFGTVVEFGVGTGNLTKRLIARNLKVYAVEPSQEMRAIAKRKLPQITLLDGDFLMFPTIDEPIHTFTSTYAFHHLTDEEKDKAIALYSELLAPGGKVVFGDTVFEDENARAQIMEEAKTAGHFRLLNDLQTEYYTTHDVLRASFKKHGFREPRFIRLNKFVWLFEAEKSR